MFTQLYEQVNGYDGQCVVSIDDTPVACAHHAEIIGSFVPFEMNRLCETILAHGYHVLLLESSERPRLAREERWLIDADLCEID